MRASKALVDRLLENRPFKLSGEEVGYREAEGPEHCGGCVHFYTREADGFHTCEIFRPGGDESVEREFVCDFWSDDGEEYPLARGR